MRNLILLCVLGFPFFAVSQTATPLSQLSQQSERRQAEIDEQLRPSADGRVPVNIVAAPLPDSDKDEVCFKIQSLAFETVDKTVLPSSFLDYLTDALSSENIRVIDSSKQSSKQSFQLRDSKAQGGASVGTPCLSATRIERITTKLQNRLVGKGFITSRVLIPEQDLSQGKLMLAFATGRVGELSVNMAKRNQTHAGRATLYNAFPSLQGEVLNLRHLEQGLENLRRVPTVSAEMDVKPGETPNYSDIVVNWQQRKFPLRLNLSVDNSGSKTTGEYLGTVSIAWDNPLHFNDIFYLSYTHNLSSGTKRTDPNNKTDKGKTSNYATSYSFPFGYWSFDIGMSAYHYDQVVVGVNRNYHYTGDTTRGSMNLSKVLYRDDKHKVTASAGLWTKSSKNYIDDAEVEVQRRRTGGWTAALSQRSYFRLGTLSSSLSYKRGTRAFGGLVAPEELFDEGTAKMKVWTADIHWQMPFHLGQQHFSWDSQLHGQWNENLLTSQERMAIGGRYSVRGFSGESTLSGDRGWYLRNDLSWHYRDNHQVYLGLDTGHVSGASTQYLLGRSLSGAVLGLKGQFSKGGDWYYDVFVGTPIDQPDGFDADATVFGFYFSYSL